MANLLSEGLTLMLLGMGIVFTFLAMLVLTMYGMSWLAQRLAPAEVARPAAILPRAASDENDELVAVVSAAIHRYRKRT